MSKPRYRTGSYLPEEATALDGPYAVTVGGRVLTFRRSNGVRTPAVYRLRHRATAALQNARKEGHDAVLWERPADQADAPTSRPVKAADRAAKTAEQIARDLEHQAALMLGVAAVLRGETTPTTTQTEAAA